jgi:sigma-B regulation protein RsbU (phosphoserine phosphatase)
MCRELNRLVLNNTRSERLTTFFYGILDFTRGVIRYCNAGHIPPFLVRENGDVKRLSEGGIVFGVTSDRSYEEAETTFGSNDRLVLLTDGITEATNAHAEEFGDDRVIELLRRHRHLSASGLQSKLLQAVDTFAPEGLRDDATLVTVSLKSGILRSS